MFDWREGVEIYFNSVSPYYLFILFATSFAFCFSWWYTTCSRKRINFARYKANQHKKTKNISEDLNTENIDLDSDILHSKLKTARHQAIVNELSAKMTPEQLKEEKEMEKVQLEAIFNLLKEQKEKFQVSNMAELQEQLSLYR